MPQNNTLDKSYLNATGSVSIPMHNDYLFRALLQRSSNTRKAIIAALLHLEITSITSAEIQNPIELGKHIEAKDFILDILILLNNHTIVNLEMQVINEYNWKERSLCYLCRSFDNLNKGEDYLNIQPAVQIGLLDFTLFPKAPEFYATYWLANEKTGEIYSDKFRLSVLDLTKIHLATEEDRFYQIDYWAALFKAQTWEELKQMAKEDLYMQEAVSTVYQLSEDERIRQQCEAREEFYRIQNTERLHKEQIIRERDEAVQKLNETSQRLDQTSQERDLAVQERNQATLERDQAAQERDQAAQERDQAAQERDQAAQERDQAAQERDLAMKRTALLEKLLQEHNITIS